MPRRRLYLIKEVAVMLGCSVERCRELLALGEAQRFRGQAVPARKPRDQDLDGQEARPRRLGTFGFQYLEARRIF